MITNRLWEQINLNNNKMLNIKLFLDDVRPVPSGYYLVTNYDQFVSFLKEHGLPIFISFDHDLGEAKTGYDCAKYLVEYCLDHVKTLPDYKVHSQNPVGKENIEKLLENFKNRRR